MEHEQDRGSDLVEWIDAYEALDLMEQRFGDPIAAKRIIADKLLDGKIIAKAGRLWESDSPKLTFKNPPLDPAELETDVVVERSIWKSSRYWTADVDLWRWPEGRFVVTQRRKPPERTIIESVQFIRAEIDALCKPPSAFSGPPLAPSDVPRKPGRPVKLDSWVRFYHVVIEIARDGKLVAGQFESQKALEDTILGLLPEGDLGQKTIAPRVRQIWNKYMIGDD